MPTFNLTNSADLAPVPYEPSSPSRLVSNVLDCRVQPLSQAASDLANLIPVKAGEFVDAVFAKVHTVEGETMALHIGDSADPDGWVASLNANALGSAVGAGAYAAAGKLYTADDAIGVSVATAAGVANIAKIEATARITRVF